MNDLISRQAAISEIMEDLKDRSLHDDPATPEDFAEGYDEGIRNAAAIVIQMPSAQPGWIPVTEKPIEGGQYIVTLKDDKEVWTDIAEWNPTFGGRWQAEFFDCEYRDIDNVVAWMPLPEPAKIGGD